VEARRAGAGDPGTCADFVPAQVPLLCGIFGDVGEADTENVIASLPRLVVGGGTVILARAAERDLRPRPGSGPASPGE
jgi:hypothetical protein